MIEHSLRLDPIYAVLGTDAVLTTADGLTIALTAIDKTAGLAIEDGNHHFQVETIKPAACVRVDELAESGLAPVDCRDGLLAMASRNWRIKSYRENAGEVILILNDETDA